MDVAKELRTPFRDGVWELRGRAADEIDMLRRALVLYGDRARMSNVGDMALQQAIDRAFENATPDPNKKNAAADEHRRR